MGASPYVRYALAKATRKGEDCIVGCPTQPWPTGAWRATPGPRTYGLYAVIDGHNGAAAAEFTAAALPDRFALELRRALAELDGAREDAVQAALGATFLGLDADFGARGELSGATLTVCVIAGWNVSVANIGDSRAILDAGGSEIMQLTYDFRLEDSAEERARIVAAGAILRRLAESGRGPCEAHEVGYGPLRVWPGGLALSRAIGDRDVGDCIVAHPYVKQLRIPETAAVRIIIASDGVWDACDNVAVAKPVRRSDVEAASREIVAQALRVRGLRDDTTVICLDLCPDVAPLSEHWGNGGESDRSERAGGSTGGSVLGCCFGTGARRASDAPALRPGGMKHRGAAVLNVRYVDFYPGAAVAPRVSVSSSPGASRSPPARAASGEAADELGYDLTEHAGRVYPPAAAVAAQVVGGSCSGGSTPGATEHAGGGFAAYVSPALTAAAATEVSLPLRSAASGGTASLDAEIGLGTGGFGSAANGGRAGTHHWGDSDVAAVFAAVAAAEAGPGRQPAEDEDSSVRSRGSRRRGGEGAAAAVARAGSDATEQNG